MSVTRFEVKIAHQIWRVCALLQFGSHVRLRAKDRHTTRGGQTEKERFTK